MGAKEPSDDADAPPARGASAGPLGASSSFHKKPLLMVDIDGVISLFGFAGHTPWTGHSGAVAERPRAGYSPGEGQGEVSRAGYSPGEGQGEVSRAGYSPGEGQGEVSYATIDGIPHFLSRAAAAHLLGLTADFDLVWASGWEEKAEEYLPRLLGLPAGLPFLQFERGVAGTGSSNAHWKLSAIDEHAGSRPLAWIDDSFNDACHAWANTRPVPTLLIQTAPERGLTSREASLLVTWARGLTPPRAGARDWLAPGATPRR